MSLDRTIMRDMRRQQIGAQAMTAPKRKRRPMKPWTLYWAPEGRPFAVVVATVAEAAVRKAPAPYNKALGEIYAVEGNLL